MRALSLPRRRCCLLYRRITPGGRYVYGRLALRLAFCPALEHLKKADQVLVDLAKILVAQRSPGARLEDPARGRIKLFPSLLLHVRIP